jgi:hypothetical protein
MDSGQLIDNHLKLIKIDNNHNVYISRRSLKHFVESRKKEMINTHLEGDILNKLYFSIDNIINVYLNYDEIKTENLNRVKYTKHFIDIREHSLSIVFDVFFNRCEICSIHFKKRKIPP